LAAKTSTIELGSDVVPIYIRYNGKYYQVPLPRGRGTGLGKPLHLINHPVRERIPITIAALDQKNVELTAEIADGWQPVFFYRSWLVGRSESCAARTVLAAAGGCSPVNRHASRWVCRWAGTAAPACGLGW
jgi:hypothetical protein